MIFLSQKIKLLLQLIKDGADSSFLLKQGLSFSQISKLFAKALEDELLSKDGEHFYVTDAGLKFLLNTKFAQGGKWISPDESYFTMKISIDSIYLPKLKDSKFLTT